MPQPGWNRVTGEMLRQQAWSPEGSAVSGDDLRRADRVRMVEEQIESRGIRNPRLLQVLRHVPRHLFVSPAQSARAYDDSPLPIGHDQTISQPYIVALMTDLARPSPADRALEIGTGSGYQAAILAPLVTHVYSLELVPELAEAARSRLLTLGIRNVTVRVGDGYEGWADEGPFDVIVGAAAPEAVPPALVQQLAPRGRLILPVGPLFDQVLVVVEKDEGGAVHTREVAAVRFVPLVRGRG